MAAMPVVVMPVAAVPMIVASVGVVMLMVVAFMVVAFVVVAFVVVSVVMGVVGVLVLVVVVMGVGVVGVVMLVVSMVVVVMVVLVLGVVVSMVVLVIVVVIVPVLSRHDDPFLCNTGCPAGRRLAGHPTCDSFACYVGVTPSANLCDGVRDVVGVVLSGAVLAAMLVAVDVAVLVHVLRTHDGLARRIAVGVAVAGAVLVAVDAIMAVAMLTGVLVTVVVMLVAVVMRGHAFLLAALLSSGTTDTYETYPSETFLVNPLEKNETRYIFTTGESQNLLPFSQRLTLSSATRSQIGLIRNLTVFAGSRERRGVMGRPGGRSGALRTSREGVKRSHQQCHVPYNEERMVDTEAPMKQVWPRFPGTSRRSALLAIAATLSLMAAVACGGETEDSADTGASQAGSAATTETAASTSETVTATTDAAQEPSVPVGHSVGMLAPDFTVETVGGESFTLSEVTGAGSPVLLYFFTTW